MKKYFAIIIIGILLSYAYFAGAIPSAPPSAGSGVGDMEKSVYDTDENDAVDTADLAANATHAVNADNATVATTTTTATVANALSANGANCSAGQAPLGVDASGSVESCWTPQANLSLVAGTYTNGYLCTYTTSGTLLNCNTNPATFVYVADIAEDLATNSTYLYKNAAGNIISATIGTGLTDTAGTLSVNVGTGANQIVQLNSSSKIPAIDGSLLTSVVAVSLSGQYIDWSSSSGGNSIANKPTLGTAATLNVGTGANQIVQLNSSAELPAVDGSNLTGLTVSQVANSLAFSGSPTTGHLAQIGADNTIVDGGVKVTDSATNSTYLYKDASGNIVSAVLGGGLLDSSGTLKAYVDIAAFSFDGGGSAIAVNAIACRVVKYAATITSYTLSLDVTSNTTILVMGDTFSDTALPSTGMGNATTSAKRGKIDTTLTGWTTTVGANMEICANVTANTAAKKATLILHGTR